MRPGRGSDHRHRARDTTGWEHVISGAALDEPDMLRELVRIVRERIGRHRGHNLFRFDLEYIEARARRHKGGAGARPWGRAAPGASLPDAGGRADDHLPEVRDRRTHIVDTWILAQHYDVTARELEGYGLKEVARHFGLAAADRTYLPAERISATFDSDPETLFRYALDDVREVRGLGAILSQSYSCRRRSFPSRIRTWPCGEMPPRSTRSSSGSICGRGGRFRPERPRTCWAAIPRLRSRGGPPRPALRRDLALSLGDARFRLRPAPGLAGDLFRPTAGSAGVPGRGEAPGTHGGDGGGAVALHALQTTFKILINSFYGYLGFPMAHFNDYAAANR